MKFAQLAFKILEDKINERKSLDEIVSLIEEESKNGKIAFCPCSRYARNIIMYIKREKPFLMDSIIACFDRSDNVNFDEDVETKTINDIPNYAEDISLLIIASNTYYEREEKLVSNTGKVPKNILKLSYFDYSLTEQNTQDILSQIRDVYNLFQDEKSKATYLMVWLSKVLNDESLTYLFEPEEEFTFNDGPLEYKGHTIDYMDNVCKHELLAELYEMKYLKPERGDVIFDVGGYKGDTAIFFASRVGEEGRVFSFEPITANFNHFNENIANNNLQNVVTCINMGCSDTTTIAKAVSIDCGAPWSFVSEDIGNIDIKLTKIDDFIKDNNMNKLDFIKMDVEGFEENVLLGAKESIQKFKPKMVVPLYHNTDDLITLPKLVQSLGSYKFYLRCKMEGPYSINLYCKPVK